MRRPHKTLVWLLTAAVAAGAAYAGYLAFQSEGGTRWMWALFSVVLALSTWRDVRILLARRDDKDR